jgi:hypothetical protein
MEIVIVVLIAIIIVLGYDLYIHKWMCNQLIIENGNLKRKAGSNE